MERLRDLSVSDLDETGRERAAYAVGRLTEVSLTTCEEVIDQPPPQNFTILLH